MNKENTLIYQYIAVCSSLSTDNATHIGDTERAAP
jgi:hypothetical protein